MPLDYRSFELARLQAVAFTPGGQFVASRMVATMIDKWAGLLDGPPMVMPLPPLLQQSLVSLRSQDGRYQAELLPDRVAFTWNRIGMAEGMDEHVFMEYANGICRTFLDNAPANAGRVALIGTKYLYDNTPAMSLSRYFCRHEVLEGPLARPENFELHAHKTYKLGSEFNINSWVRCKHATITLAVPDTPIPETHESVVVEQDINTLAEEANETVFSKEQIARFFTMAYAEMHAILKLYFPGGGE